MDSKPHIRYRIYAQNAEKADGKYPARAKASLMKLHKAIKKDSDYWEDNRWETSSIIQRFFIPYNFTNINPKYFTFIGSIATYFNCYAIWEERFVSGTTATVKSTLIIGHSEEVKLAYHYISKIINNVEAMRFNIRSNYRTNKINQRRRGYKPNPNNAHSYSSKKYYEAIDIINEVAHTLLVDKPVAENNHKKAELVIRYIKQVKSLNYKDYPGEPQIHHAYCRVGKFVNKRIIQVF